jgi:hypothetical protein
MIGGMSSAAKVVYLTRRLAVVVVLALLSLLAGGVTDRANSQEICLLRPATEVELPTKCLAHPLLFEAQAEFVPMGLPRSGRVPIAFHLDSHVDGGGEHPPPLKDLILDLDKYAEIDVTEIPACGGAIVRSGIERARRLCGDAVVGAGRVRIEIEEPEGSGPRTIPLSLTIFSGGKSNGVSKLLFQFEPVPPSRKPLMAIGKSQAEKRGRFGTQVTIAFPRIADGNGSIVKFGFSLRRWGPAARMLGILRAVCRDGSLYFRTTGIFLDGTRISGTSLRTCTGTS